MSLDRSFYKNKKVLVTGNTGFKGSWICAMLTYLGAEVAGYALEPETEISLYNILHMKKYINSIIGDIRDLELLKKQFDIFSPEIVIHMAAQPIVRKSYSDPVYTYSTNVMGTVNVLECCRMSNTVRSVVNVTTDKVYNNKEWVWGYRESDELNGFDPYSNSKSCSELVTDSYKKCFLNVKGIAVSTVRAGNVIGGGDFSPDRIIPDCIRASLKQNTINIRNPYSVRPYQHVLDPLTVYLEIAQRQYNDFSLNDCYNVGPDESDCITTGELANKFCKYWGENANWNDCSEKNAPHEAGFLKLDCSKLKEKFKWKPTYNIDCSVKKTVEWTKYWINNNCIEEYTRKQIDDFFSGN